MNSLSTIISPCKRFIDEIQSFPGVGARVYTLRNFPFNTNTFFLRRRFIVFVTMNPVPTANDFRLSILSPDDVVISYDFHDVSYWLQHLDVDTSEEFCDRVVMRFVEMVSNHLLNNNPNSIYRTDPKKETIEDLFLSGKIQTPPGLVMGDSDVITLDTFLHKRICSSFKVLYQHHSDLIAALAVTAVLEMFDEFTSFNMPKALITPELIEV